MFGEETFDQLRTGLRSLDLLISLGTLWATQSRRKINYSTNHSSRQFGDIFRTRVIPKVIATPTTFDGDDAGYTGTAVLIELKH